MPTNNNQDKLPQLPGTGQPNTGGVNPYPSGSQTLGQPMYPWLMRWTGGHQAPMSDYENQALGDMSNYAKYGFGLGGAQDYLNREMGGQWLFPNNPYFDQIETAGSNLLKGQQYDTLKRIGSSAAAGGNGLSGARLAAEGRYLSDSNQAFNQMMAELRANQYARERGYMHEDPNQLMDLSRTEMSGLGQLMNMGAVPRNIQTQEMQGQYQDWLRQIGALRDEYRYPDQLATAFLGTNKYPGYQDPKYGNSTADQLLPLLAMLFGGGGKGGGNGLVSFGNGGSGGVGSGNNGSTSLLSVGNSSGLLNQAALWIANLLGITPQEANQMLSNPSPEQDPWGGSSDPFGDWPDSGGGGGGDPFAYDPGQYGWQDPWAEYDSNNVGG